MESKQTHIHPDLHSGLFPLRELLAYRDLLGLWVRRDFVAKYRQTLLGPVWFIAQPVITTAVFILIFSKGLKVPTEGVPPSLFYFSGLLIWNYVSQCLGTTSNTLIANSGLFKKVYFPRLILPLAHCVSSWVTVGLQASVFCLLYLGLRVKGEAVFPSSTIGFLPFIAFQIMFLSFGLGLWVAALTVSYRDFHHLMALVTPLWMYATPISYPLSAIPPEWRWVLELNPLTLPIEGLRLGLLGVGSFNLQAWSLSLLLTFAVVVSGLWIFRRVERNFVDSV